MSRLASSTRPPGLPTQLWNRWMLLDSSEKPLFDKIDDCPPRLVPPEYSADQEVIGELEHDPPIWFGIPLCARNSNLTVSRAHFYLELARELDVPLCIDPVRSEYLQSLLSKLTGADRPDSRFLRRLDRPEPV